MLVIIENFAQSFNEYENNKRSNQHVLWCWTLNVIARLCLRSREANFNESFLIYDNAVSFLLKYRERVIRVLRSSSYFDIMGTKQNKNLAQLEEYNYLTNLLCEIYLRDEVWKMNYLDFYNETLYELHRYSLKYFSNF